MKEKRPVLYDMFAGAGLFSFAFAKEGFAIGKSIEVNPVAAATYRRNIGHDVEVRDVRYCEPSGHCDVLIAGPPCQGFSTLGLRAPHDHRNALCFEVAKWAQHLMPKVVVVENVAAFAGTTYQTELAERLEKLGYQTHTSILDAVHFGVAQKRRRFFLVASLGDMPVIKTQPSQKRTVREAWCGLSEKPNDVNWHYSPVPTPLALERMKLIPEGGDKRDIIRKNPRLAAPSWFRMGVEATDAWGRMEWDQPANTLRTCFNNPSKGRYIHPTQNRVISLREAARLHSIPDSWYFEGKPCHIAQQIGNSVPPLLGRAVARSIFKII